MFRKTGVVSKSSFSFTVTGAIGVMDALRNRTCMLVWFSFFSFLAPHFALVGYCHLDAILGRDLNFCSKPFDFSSHSGVTFISVDKVFKVSWSSKFFLRITSAAAHLGSSARLTNLAPVI